jgi:hypothetical protein
MLQISKLNSDGSSLSSHDSSRNSFEFASPLSQTFSPTKSPSPIANVDQSISSNIERQSLKIIFKRSSNNEYQIKNIISTTSNNSDSSLVAAAASNSYIETQQSYEFESNLKTRPKRNVATKRFSNDAFGTTSEESNDKDFVAFVSKSRKRKLTQTDLNNNDTLKKKRSNTNASSRGKQQQLPQKKPPVKKVKPPPPIKLYCDENANALEPFFKSDIQYKGFEEKARVLNNPPRVMLDNQTLALALCENGTGIIRSKAFLHFHLYISNSTPCIYCPLCNKYLSVSDFSKHIHVTIDDIDDPFDADEQKAAKKILENNKFSILPYSVSGEFSKFQLDIWQSFSKKYVIFRNKSKKVEPPQKEEKNSNSKTVEVNSNDASVNKISKKYALFSTALSDDEFESESTNDVGEKQVSRIKSANLVDFRSLKEDILLSEEE